MEHRIKAGDVEHRERWMKRIEDFAENVPAEIFKWLGWTTAIAAVHVVDERVQSSWLQYLAVLLSMLLVMRVQWFLGTKHPEEKQPDGSVVVKFKPGLILLSIPATFAAYYLAFGMARLIAQSELLPPTTATMQATVTPEARPKAATPVAPPVATPKTPPAPRAAQKQKPQGLP